MTGHIYENSCENLRFPYNLLALFRMLTLYASNKMFCYNYISISTGFLIISDSKMLFSFWKVNSSDNKFLFSFLSEIFPHFFNFSNVLIIHKVINNNLFVNILCLFGLLGFHTHVFHHVLQFMIVIGFSEQHCGHDLGQCEPEYFFFFSDMLGSSNHKILLLLKVYYKSNFSWIIDLLIFKSY